MRYRCIDRRRNQYPVNMMCRLLEVSSSGYYVWRVRPESQRARSDRELTRVIRRLHADSDGVYGSRKITADLRDEGYQCGRHKVARLMRKAGLKGCPKRRFKVTTQRDPSHPVADNLLEQDFTAEGPNERWASDITYISTRQGWLYLAVVMDLYSRRIIGWSMGRWISRHLVIDALNMAISQRLPEGALIHHSDRGSQGEFKRSSQHLNEEDMRWPYVDNRREGVLFDHQCARPADRRYLVVSIDTDSGVRSHKAFRAKMLARLPVCRRQLVAGGSEKEAECPRFSSRRSRGATCRLPNARKLRSYTRKSLVSAPLPESLDELHPRSLVNYGEMLRPDPVVSITVRRRHSGTQTGVHDDRRLRSSPRTRRYVPGYRNASRAASVRRMVFR